MLASLTLPPAYRKRLLSRRFLTLHGLRFSFAFSLSKTSAFALLFSPRHAASPALPQLIESVRFRVVFSLCMACKFSFASAYRKRPLSRRFLTLHGLQVQLCLSLSKASAFALLFSRLHSPQLRGLVRPVGILCSSGAFRSLSKTAQIYLNNLNNDSFHALFVKILTAAFNAGRKPKRFFNS